MSEKPHDEQALEDFLGRRHALSRRYREAALEQPPAAVDDAILAAARRAAGAHPQAAGEVSSRARRNWAARWGAPLATAAVIVLAVALTVVLERESEVADPGRSSRQRPAASAPAAVPDTAQAPAATDATGAKRPAAGREPEPSPAAARAGKREAQPMATADTAPGQPAEQTFAENVQKRAAERDQVSAPAAQRAALAPAELESQAGSDEAQAPAARVMRREALEEAAPAPIPGPQDRLSDIAVLYEQERTEAADRALVAFCRDFPGYKLPAGLLQQARRLAADCPGY